MLGFLFLGVLGVSGCFYGGGGGFDPEVSVPRLRDGPQKPSRNAGLLVLGVLGVPGCFHGGGGGFDPETSIPRLRDGPQKTSRNAGFFVLGEVGVPGCFHGGGGGFDSGTSRLRLRSRSFGPQERLSAMMILFCFLSYFTFKGLTFKVS